MGRAPTQAESQFLQPYIDSGTLNYQQAAQYLQSTPEALQSRQKGQQSAFTGALTANNSSVLSQAADAANSSFAQNGRQFSSGQGNSVLQAGQQLAAAQSPMIAGNLAGQAGQLNSVFNQQGQSALQRNYDLTDSNTAYGRQMALNAQNWNNYQNLMRQQNTMGLQQQLIGGGMGLLGGFGGSMSKGLGSSAASGIAGLF